MTCSDFERWLDEGLPEGAVAVAAHAHAAACSPCAAALAAARELDQLLDAPGTSAPASLTDSVMMRIAVIESATHPLVTLAPELFDTTQAWWVRAAAQPAAALAFILAALFLWQRDALNLYGVALIANVSGGLAHALDARVFASASSLPGAHATAVALAKPEVMLGIAFAIAPALAWVSAWLWQWAERRV